MSVEAYAVAVKLRLVNEVSGGLASMSRHFNKTGLDAKALQREIHAIGLQSKVAFGMVAAGAAGLALLKLPLDEAKKFQVEVGKFASLGFGDGINRQAERFASGMKTIGTSARDNMAIMGDAMAVFKDLKEAQMVAPLMAKMKYANEVLFGTNGPGDKKLMDMMKVAEFRRGTTSPEEFARQVNYAQMAIAGSRNRVDPSAMLLAMKTGGLALSQRTNEAFYLGAEPLIQEFGGSRYGTGAMSLYQNLVQARGAITAQQELYRLGLLNPSMVEFNMLGRLKKARPGAFYGSQVLEKEGELALLEKVLLPAFAKHGITSEEDVLREIGMIAGNRTGTSLLSRVYQQMDKLKMQTAANFHAQNLDQATATAAGTLEGRERDLHAKWATLMKDLGVTILPMAIKGVQGLTWLLKGVSSFAERFPTLTAGLMGAFGAISIALLGGGVGLGLNAAFRGLALILPGLSGVAGIGGVTTALTGPAGLIVGLGAAGIAIGSFLDEVTNHALGKWADKVAYAFTGDEKFKTDGIGGVFYDFMHDKNGVNILSQNSWDPHRNGSQIVPPSKSGSTVHVTNVQLDGRQIAHVVTKHQANAASRPQTGLSGFDYNMMYPSPANP